MMEALQALGETWWAMLLIGLVFGSLITAIAFAFDNSLVRLREGLVVTEKSYIEGLNAQIARLIKKLREEGLD